MSQVFARLLAVACALVGALAPLLAVSRPDPSALCVSAAERAAQETGVPLRVLIALTLTETGRKGSQGGLVPWPWALNKGGESLWFDSREEAQAQLEDELAKGTTNIDVGCFQLNHRWHGAAFDTLETMLDPESNASYAARLMLQLYQDSGDWTAAAAAYHSSTPDYAERYLARFKPIYAALEGVADLPTEAAAPERQRGPNRFPLLLAGATQGAGSLVPLPSSASPLIGGP